MGLTVVSGGSGQEFEKCPAGSYVARCFMVADIGTQKTEYQGEVKTNKTVVLAWEILEDGIRREDGQPFVMSKTFTASLHEKSGLRKTLDGWRGRAFTPDELKGFQLDTVLGVYAQLTVVHTQGTKDATKTYANISSIAPLHKAIPKPAPINANVLFDMDSKDYNVGFEVLPKWIKEKVEVSPEWNAKFSKQSKPTESSSQTIATQGNTAGFEDDLPPF